MTKLPQKENQEILMIIATLNNTLNNDLVIITRIQKQTNANVE